LPSYSAGFQEYQTVAATLTANGSEACNFWRYDQLDKGNHSIRAGFDVVHNQAVDGFALNRNNPRGTY
jgi:hypothetical protein